MLVQDMEQLRRLLGSVLDRAEQLAAPGLDSVKHVLLLSRRVREQLFGM